MYNMIIVKKRDRNLWRLFQLSYFHSLNEIVDFSKELHNLNPNKYSLIIRLLLETLLSIFVDLYAWL